MKWETLKTLDVSKLNAKMVKYAKMRTNLKEQWQTALSSGAFAREKPQRVYEVTKIKDLKLPIKFLEDKIVATKKELSRQSLAFGRNISAGFLVAYLGLFSYLNTQLVSIPAIAIATAIAMLITPQPFWNSISTIKKLKKQFKIQQSTESNMQYIGESILQTLCEHGKIKTPYSQTKLVMWRDDNGEVYLTIKDCPDYERAIFSKAVREYLGPIDNPRYILKRQDEGLRTYYFAVPKILSGKKEFVETLASKLEGAYGWLDVIYTRTPIGRKELLKARYNSVYRYTTGIQKNKCWM